MTTARIVRQLNTLDRIEKSLVDLPSFNNNEKEKKKIQKNIEKLKKDWEKNFTQIENEYIRFGTKQIEEGRQFLENKLRTVAWETANINNLQERAQALSVTTSKAFKRT